MAGVVFRLVAFSVSGPRGQEKNRLWDNGRREHFLTCVLLDLLRTATSQEHT